MRANFALLPILRMLLLLLVLAISTFGQSKAIEPCQATPSPIKASSTNAPANPSLITPRASETLIDSTIPDDAEVEKILGPYSGKVRALNVVIGKLEGELKKGGGVGAGSLGNFVTDGLRAAASVRLGKPVVLAITNAGGLRKNGITPGELRASDIFELLPFENALIQLDLTGAQVLKLLRVVTNGRDAQAGASIQFRWNSEDKPEFVSARLINGAGGGQQIDPRATYRVVTIDYLLNLESGSYAILKEGKNVTHLGVTMRDALMEYVKAETDAGRPIRARLDRRFIQVGPGPAKSEAPPR